MELCGLLDAAYDKLQNGEIQESLKELDRVLQSIWLTSTEEEWDSFVQKACLTHPIREAAHADPLTWRAFHQPRGYPGDAVLLDMMYFPDRVDLSDTSALGQHFCHYNVERPAVKAVTNRRKILARAVDEVAATVDRPKVLSVACGHLREIELSQAAANGQLQEYVGFDQDVDSLAEVNKRYQHLGVKTCHGSVRDFLTSKAQFEDFDLVYAAGLFDYLNEKTAKRLVACLFNILRSGGRLLIANFLPGLPDTGYMESYAGWKLIYRSEPEMQALLSEIPNRTAQNARLFTEEEEKILFLQVEKR